MNIGDALQHFLDSVLFEGAHTFRQRRGYDFRYAGMLLDMFLDGVATEQQLVQSNTALVAGATARIASDR